MKNLDNPYGNPRTTRAFAQSARTRANAEPSEENLDRLLSHEIAIAKGPNKSRQMAMSAALLQDLDSTHVAFVDWTSNSYGGSIVPREVAATFYEERRTNNCLPEYKQEYTAWHEILSHGYPRWTSGYKPDSVTFLDTIPPSKLLVEAQDTLMGYDGEAYSIEADCTATAAIKKVIISKQQTKAYFDARN